MNSLVFEPYGRARGNQTACAAERLINMPGKVNPVIPEAFAIIGNDQTITLTAEADQLEQNAFQPVLLHRLFESIETLRQAAAP